MIHGLIWEEMLFTPSDRGPILESLSPYPSLISVNSRKVFDIFLSFVLADERRIPKLVWSDYL